MKKVAIVLAAGVGKRMHSKLPKVLHKICGREMVLYPIETAKKAGFSEVVAVISENMDTKIFDKDTIAYQKMPLGTGDAAKKGIESLKELPGDTMVLILTGDNPLIEPSDLSKLYEFHISNGNDASLLSAISENPKGLGRVIKLGKDFIKIVEEKDATPEEKQVNEINTGIYLFKKAVLEEALNNLSNDNAQQEYYLTDTLYYIKEKGYKIGVLKMDRMLPIYGVNNRLELSIATQLIQRKILDRLMLQGVTIINPATTSIDYNVDIGRDTIIYPGCVIQGASKIGSECEIGPNTRIINTNIGNGTDVYFSVVMESSIGNNCNIGPFSYVRPGNILNDNVKVGTFVEIKKSRVDEGSKIPHLSYIGDATIGKNVNIGAGTITCNFSGLQGPHKKNPTFIEDNVFIGSHNTLVAPVVIHKNAYTAAGSVINREVPEWALAIGRAKQINKEGWVRRKKENVGH
jgi:bifunctional UDP-N-acetylglucosamine pyrophosphorylase/glucosamine-1-phosphate N-acetyltransferase